MQNVVPRNVSDLLTACQDAAIGAAQVGPVIGLVHNTQVAINFDIEGFLTSRGACDAGKLTLSARRAVVRSLADDSRDFLIVTRDVLKPRLGNQYSEAWDAVGFVGSLSVPMLSADLQPYLQASQRYLLANPTAEVPVLNVTAARAESLFNDMSAARGAVNLQETEVGNLQAARDVAADKLRERLRWLIEETGRLLDALDPRWLAFGFNMPGADATPDVPDHVQAHSLAGQIIMGWIRAARAEHYRIWKRVVGVDNEFVAAGSPTDLNFTIPGLTVGAQVEVCVSAVNNGGESSRSPVVLVTVV